jgi:hypothetical protein
MPSASPRPKTSASHDLSAFAARGRFGRSVGWRSRLHDGGMHSWLMPAVDKWRSRGCAWVYGTVENRGGHGPERRGQRPLPAAQRALPSLSVDGYGMQAHTRAQEVSVVPALIRNRRAKIITVGYAIVAVFGLVAIVARWGFGVSGTIALVAGIVAAAPILIAVVGDRITGIKAFSVEVSLAQITVPVQVDLTRAVMAIAEMGPSGSPELEANLRAAIQADARLLRLNLRNNDYWWSTRVYLVAALATDYTAVERLVFVRGQEEEMWVGMIDPKAARERLAEEFPQYERNYRDLRNVAVLAGDVNAPLDRDAEITSILMSWPGKFNWNEAQEKQIVTSDLLRSWLGLYLDTEALPHGPLTPLLQYQVNLRRHRFTGLTTDGRLIAVVDKSELATRTTDELLRHQLA